MSTLKVLFANKGTPLKKNTKGNELIHHMSSFFVVSGVSVEFFVRSGMGFYLHTH